MAAELEDELQNQLTEQQEALEGVRQLLAADPDSAETAELLAELEAGIAETESALLGLKRQRLLAELDALQAPAAAAQHSEAQAAEEVGQHGVVHLPHLPPGALCIFRHTDGRHYFGRVTGCSSATHDAAAMLQLHFVHPTRSFQLEPLYLPAASCHPTSADALRPTAGALHPGARVVAQLPGRQLWEAAEVAQLDWEGQRAAVVALADHQRCVLPLAALSASAHAPDPHGGSGSDDGGGDTGSGELSRSSGEGGSSGSDYDDEDEEEEEDGDGAGLGGDSFARVSFAVAEAAELVQQQAEAGPQSSTLLFFGSEAHTRGIGSKLLAKMGFKGAGHGLGRNQHGMQQALQAVPLKRGAGLGVDGGGGGTKEGSKKRRRSGKQRRQDKAAAAGLEAREAARQAQAELEKRTGSVGLFAVLNSIVGDASQAQAVKEANLGMGRSGDAAGVGGTSRHGHLFGGSGSRRPAPAKEEDRRALAKRADDLEQLRQKVQRLSEMAGRNAKDKVMLPQIRRALAEAQAALAAAERQHAASHKAIHNREKLKRMTKF